MEATRYRRIEKLGQGTYGVVYKALVESGTNKGVSPSLATRRAAYKAYAVRLV